MPELPEVQTVVNDLQEIVGDQFTGFFSKWPKALKNISPKTLERKIVGKKIKAVRRISKNIFIFLSDRTAIGIHLKMTGKLILVQHKKMSADQYQPISMPKHLHHIFHLKKFGALEFHDVRKFATITLYSKEEIQKIEAGLGIEPMDNFFSPKALQIALSKKPAKKIKEVLMDQSIIRGIGNIYASEILFAAHILPTRLISSLTQQEIKMLATSITSLLSKAITLRGTSISDYRDASGQKGQFQNYLKVYKKDTLPCQKCGTIIKKTVMAQRSTFYCPKCQK